MIELEILSPDGAQRLEADAVFLPGAMGEFEVLNNHAPIISALVKGSIKWRNGSETSCLEISGGVARVKDNKIQVCVQN
ncbi:MAG: hypothetical protein MJY41_04585 [Bacteroidales bacterium]|nr:hypothetical protein [Bacteroidales bacterium]